MRLLLLALALVLLSSSGFAQGVLLIKEQSFLAESTAVPLEYRSADKFSAAWNVMTTAGRREQLRPERIVIDVPYANFAIPAVVANQSDYLAVATGLDTLRNTITRHPKLQKYLLRFVTDHQMVIDQYKRGTYLVNGRWMTAAEYAKSQLIRQEQLRQEAKGLENSLLNLRLTAQQIGGPNGEEAKPETRQFHLIRKLPKTRFEQLYEINPYVIECESNSRQACVLVTRSIATLDNRLVACNVVMHGDIDVVLRDGREERVPVFVEYAPSESDLQYREIVRQIEARTSELKRVQAALGEISGVSGVAQK